MAGIPTTIVRNRRRLDEIVRVLTKYGFAAWVQRSSSLVKLPAIERVVEHRASPEVLAMSDGERLRRAFSELGTTWIKFGQMLSMRGELISDEVAEQLTLLQEQVPADDTEVVFALVEQELGGPVSSFFRTFAPQPIASGSVAQVHRATLPDGTAVAVKVLHDGVEHRVSEDLELMGAIASHLDSDPELARLRPSRLVGEFAEMMIDAIDLSHELSHLQQFARNFADEPDVVIPNPYPELSRRRVLTMSLISGCSLADRASVEATGWDVDALVHRAADIFLEMVFRDSFFHADPHPGNLRLPDGSHVALLDFGDVGRLSGDRKTQLEDMVLAIGMGDVEFLVDVFIDMTSPSAAVDRSRLASSIDAWLTGSLLDGLGQIDVSALVQGGMHILYDNDLVLPADLGLLFRVLVRLQGLGREVNTEVRITELLESHVRPILMERLNPAHAIRSAGRAVAAWQHLATVMPREVGSILDSCAPDNLDSTSASATPTGSSTRSSTVSWRPLRSSRLRS
jgi:ubiquinone biosynthesis protein